MVAFQVKTCSGRRLMVNIESITSWADKGHFIELHLVNRGVFKVDMTYDSFVEFLSGECMLSWTPYPDSNIKDI